MQQKRFSRIIAGIFIILIGSIWGSICIFLTYILYSHMISIFEYNQYNSILAVLLRAGDFLASIVPILGILLSIFAILFGIYMMVFSKPNINTVEENDDGYTEI